MKPKKKIIQAVLFEGNLNFLKCRKNEIEIIDKLIIFQPLNVVKQPITDENLNTFFGNRNNFEIYNFNEISNFWNEVENKIISSEIDFEDVIVICKENEFVDFYDFSEILQKLKFEPIVLKQRAFWWSKKFYSEKLLPGSIVFTLSQFLIEKKILSTIERTKKTDSNFTDNAHVNGWSFNFFQNRPIDSYYFIINRLPYNSTENKLKIFDNNFSIPSFFQNLFSEEITDMERVIEISDEIIGSIDVPKNKWYESDNFEKDYKLNEVYKIILSKLPEDEDFIVFNYDNCRFEFKFKELKNKFLTEIINPS